MIILGASRGIVSYTSGPSFDPDAQAIINGIVARSGTIPGGGQTAINDFVVSLKGFSIWSMIDWMAGMVGGNAACNGMNWILPGTDDIVWSGTITQNANGVTGNGTDGYGDTGVTPTDVGANGGFTFYKRVHGTGDNNIPVGVDDGALNSFVFVENNAFGQKYGRFGGDEIAVQAGAPGIGTWAVNRTSSTDLQLYYNGASVNTNTNLVVFVGLALPFFILARNQGGSENNFCNGNYCFFALHAGMTPTQAANFRTAIQSLQLALSRNV